MHYLKGMQEPDPAYKLLYDLRSIVLLQVLLLLDELKEINALHQFCNDVDVGLGLDTLLELQQKWVRNYLHYTALVAELYQTYAISALA